MNWLHSFRWRILLGTVLWTLGLIPLMHLLFLVVHGQLRFMPGWAIGVFLVFATLCILSGIWQFRAGLLPFGRLRRQLLGLRDGSGDRIEGTYPTEVQPLVNDLNSLLEHRERIVRRALAKAGDLAHGLKTPLAVLAQEAAIACFSLSHGAFAQTSDHSENLSICMDALGVCDHSVVSEPETAQVAAGERDRNIADCRRGAAPCDARN